MNIEHIAVKNFRALEDVECSFNRRVNVIVAPNAAGKTTVLQAIRLAKALLAETCRKVWPQFARRTLPDL